MAKKLTAQFQTLRFNKLIWLAGLFIVAYSALLVGCSRQSSQSKIWYIHNFGHSSQAGDWQGEIIELDPITLDAKIVFRTQSDNYIEDAGLSPDGKLIAYVMSPPREGEKSAWLIDSQTGKSTEVVSNYLSVDFYWLDDQRLIVMATNNRWEPPNQDEWKLFNVAKSQLQPLIAPEGIPIHCRVSRSKTHFGKVPLLSDSFIALGHLEIQDNILLAIPELSLKVDGFPLLGGGSCQSWTPDNQRVVFSGANYWNVSEIYLVSKQGKSVEQLTNFEKDYEQSLVDEFALSPNGQWVIASVGVRLPQSPNLPTGLLIALTDVGKRKIEFLGEWRSFGDFVWSPDSKYVATSFMRRDGSGQEVYLIDPATKEIKPLTSDGGAKQVFDWR